MSSDFGHILNARASSPVFVRDCLVGVCCISIVLCSLGCLFVDGDGDLGDMNCNFGHILNARLCLYKFYRNKILAHCL